MKDKVILTVAPTGAWPQKSDTPYIPTQPKEIADEVYACWEAGASIAHIHVRDDNDQASMNIDKFIETVTLVRERCNIVINTTTSGGLGLSDDDRMKPFITLKPELASYDCGSMNWAHTTTFINEPKFLEKLGMTMKENNVKPEIEVFDAGMIYNAIYYLKKGILEAPLHFQFCLGCPGGSAATVENLVYLKGLIPEGSTWSAFGIGHGALPVLYTTLALGGHVRVGMEDNILLHKDKLATSNVDFVERVKALVKEMGKEIATPDETRKMLGLKNC